MLFADVVFVGVDPTAGTRPMHFAALDADRNVLSLEQGDLEAALAFAAGLGRAVVAVAAPQSLSESRLSQPALRRRFNLNPEGRTWAKWRLGDFELRRRNIRLYRSPTTEKDAPAWVRNGLRVHQRLRELGFEPWEAERSAGERRLLEVNPHACFAVLLERRPLPKRTMEGRMQRQLLLYLEGLDVPNPMNALVEITRHHLLSGHLPLEALYLPDQLDALMAAYTASLTQVRPERVSQVGDPEEGLITLPVAALKEFYP